MFGPEADTLRQAGGARVNFGPNHFVRSYQIRKCDFTVSDVVIDVLDVLTRLNFTHLPDDSVIPKLGDDKIPFGIRIRIGRVSDLKRELGQRETGVLGPSSDPANVGIMRWPIGVKPEFGRTPCGLDERCIQSPKSNVMARPWAIINCLLEADVLAPAEKIKRTERGGRIRRVEYECSDHMPRASQSQSVSL
jgi:hypothetical protein